MSDPIPPSSPDLRVVGSEPAGDARVERARAGDREAWKALYLEHFSDVLRLVAHATGDVAIAEELTQEAFAVALAGLHRFDGRCGFGGWLRGIAMKLVHKHWRKNRRRDRAHHRLRAVPAAPAGGPDERLTTARRAEALAQALAELPPHLREAFVLADVQGVSAAQASEEFGISPGNFRVRATRARARLRERLAAMGLLDEERLA